LPGQPSLLVNVRGAGQSGVVGVAGDLADLLVVLQLGLAALAEDGAGRVWREPPDGGGQAVDPVLGGVATRGRLLDQRLELVVDQLVVDGTGEGGHVSDAHAETPSVMAP